MQQPLPLHRQEPHFRPTTVLLAALIAALVVACGLPAVANAVVPSFSLSEPANNLHVKNNLSINGYSSNVDIQAQCNLPNNAPGLTNFDCTYMNRWVSIGLSVFGPEGTRTLTVTATAQDGSGQQTVVNRTVIVDRTAPVTTISSGPSGGGYTGHDFTWNFSANETSVFWCRIDAEAWVSCTSPFTATGVADGSHTFDVRADDQAGNNGASASASFTVSNAPPQAGVAYVNGASVVGGQSNYVNSSTASWNLTSTRGDALLECSVDASPTWQACSTAVGFTVSGLTDGQHTLDVRAYLAGPTDVQDPPVRSTIVVDTIAPMLDFTSAKRDHAGTSATIDWGTSEQIVDSYCNIGPVSFHPCPTQFTDLAGGTHELVISVIDRAGNWSQDTAFTFRTYPSPPETTVSSAQSPTSPVAEARFTLSSSAAGSTSSAAWTALRSSAAARPRASRRAQAQLAHTCSRRVRPIRRGRPIPPRHRRHSRWCRSISLRQLRQR